MVEASSGYQHRVRRCLTGLALALMLLLWSGTIQAHEAAPGLDDLSIVSQPDVSAAPAQNSRVFLPLVVTNRIPSTFSLIDQALAAGEIDMETALIYKVFATYGDGRLPVRFRGDNSRVIDSDAVSEAAERYATLTPATRATLLPFLIPPIYRGSWYDLQARGAAGVAFPPGGDDQELSDDPEPIEEGCEELATDLFVPLECELGSRCL